jgi:putative nucleotidyltransferase with HDIG domain
MVLLSLALLPSVLIGIFAYRNARLTLETRVQAQLTSIATLKKTQLTTWIEDRAADARLLGENFLNEEHFTEILDPRIPAARRLAFAGFLTDNLRSLQRTRQGYEEIFFVDTGGRVVLSTDRSHVGAVLLDDPDVTRTLATATGTFISDVHCRTADSPLEMAFGHGLHAVDLSTSKTLSRINGAVIIRVRMDDTIYAFLGEWPSKGATGEAFLVRARGQTVRFVSPLRFDARAPLTIEIPMGGRTAQPAQLAVSGQEGIGAMIDYRGVPVLAAYRVIPPTGWGFVAKMDAGEAFAPVAELTKGIALTTALILLAGAIAGVLLAGTLTHPLTQLVATIHSVAAGHYEPEFDISRSDEFGVLARAFRHMIVTVRERSESLARTNAELARAYDATIEGWSRALDLRDKETEGHSKRVAELTLRLARVLRVPDSELVHIRRGALLHDIGKIGIPDRILLKPGPLTDEEMAVMRRHPVYAYELLAPIEYLRMSLDIPYCHHERWNGTGYPRGLKGDEIPLAARIFAVADVWDACRSDRPYRPAWSEGQARRFIADQAGRHLDPRVVEAFLRTVGERSRMFPAGSLHERRA